MKTSEPTVIPVPPARRKSSRRNRWYAALVYYPSFWWNVWNGRVTRRWEWWTEIDDDLVLGAVPFRSDVGKLVQLGVRAVVNTCEEFPGHARLYQELGITQFHMPTTDFTHPEIESVVAAVDFMESQIAQGHRIYVHCKAGRARSATVAICFLMANRNVSAQEAQQLLKKRTQVLATIWSRPVVEQFAQRLAQRKKPAAPEPKMARPK